jgi:hypothetical protein
VAYGNGVMIAHGGQGGRGGSVAALVGRCDRPDCDSYGQQITNTHVHTGR